MELQTLNKSLKMVQIMLSLKGLCAKGSMNRSMPMRRLRRPKDDVAPEERGECRRQDEVVGEDWGRKDHVATGRNWGNNERTHGPRLSGADLYSNR